MPGMGGKKFLETMKSDDRLCSIPVIVVSTSDAQQDIVESYKLHAAGYVQKSPSPEKLRKIIQTLTQYWFATSLLARN